MALIPGYEYDIFISYAHVDNAKFPGQTEGWIEQFYTNLNLLLAKRFGRMDMVKIWWDSKKLDGSTVFDDTIAEGIEKSAIMICLNSPGYLASSYCKQELDLFYKKAAGEKTGLKIADRSRILNVLLNNIPFNEWPKELSGTSGFHFHNAKDASDYGDPFETLTPEFRTKMQDVRDAVWHILSDFKTELTEPEKTKETAVASGKEDETFTIYMGEVADTLRSQRKRVITEIEKKGYKVITGVPPPDEAAAHEAATKKALETAHLSVSLLDEFPGREIIGAPEIWYPQKQTELALEVDKPQLIWVPAETDFEIVEEEQYKKFLKEVETGKSSSNGYEFIRGSKSTLAQQIIELADKLNAKRNQKHAEIGTTSVLLDTHYNDQMYAFELSKTLLENNIQPFVNPQEDDPRKNINLLGDRISQVRKLIFLYGSVSKEWVMERMSAALQLIITNNYPIDDFFVYMAPPFKEGNSINLNQRFLKINVVDSSNNSTIDTQVLSKFLMDLKAMPA